MPQHYSFTSFFALNKCVPMGLLTGLLLAGQTRGCVWVHAAQLELNACLDSAFSPRVHLEQGVASAPRSVFIEHHILFLNKSVEFTLSSKQSPRR